MKIWEELVVELAGKMTEDPYLSVKKHKLSS
jgi:hypothetical protein